MSNNKPTNIWKDQAEAMEKMLKLLNPLRARITEIKRAGEAWEYLGSTLFEVFEKTVINCEDAYVAAQEELQRGQVWPEDYDNE